MTNSFDIAYCSEQEIYLIILYNDIYKDDKFHTQVSWAWEKLYNLRVWLVLEWLDVNTHKIYI